MQPANRQPMGAIPNLNSASTAFQNSARTRTAPAVRGFTPDIAEAWDRFVLAHPAGTFFHLSGWKRVLEKTFGYQPCYSYVERGERLTAVAPFFSISNWIVGRCLISVPLAAYGGICAEDEESEQTLLNHIKQFAASQRVDYVELRNRNQGLLPGFHRNTLYATFTTELSSDPAANLKRLPRDTRYMIRKAEKAGLQTRHGWDQLGDFYSLFAQSMHRLGTPVFPRSLFENLASEFANQSDLFVVYARHKPVAGVVSFFFRDAILPYYAGAAPEAPQLAASNLMYWELMKDAAQRGIRCFDFGRSKQGTGSYAFKTQWNMRVEPLAYQVHLVRRREVPNFSPLNPKFKLAARIWQRLPLSLTSWMGPRVVRWFP
jgi:FemAB-related protein (PEP-CTERM system-associated)